MCVTKLLEIRDRHTFIACIAIDMNPTDTMQHYLLRRYGFPCDGRPNIAISHVNCHGHPLQNDPYYWGDRTWRTAHHYIIENWHSLADGDVVDVEFILGETTEKKKSERYDEH